MSHRKIYLLASTILIAAVAVVVYITQSKPKQPVVDVLASEASTRACGPKNLSSEDEKRILSQWFANPKALDPKARASAARAIEALPQGLKSALQAQKIRFAYLTTEAPFNCSPSNKPTNQDPAICLRNTGREGTLLIIAPAPRTSSSGHSKIVDAQETLEESIVPVAFWILSEVLFKTPDNLVRDPQQISRSNRLLQLKKYIIESLDIGADEEEYYFRTYGASGRKNPRFINRSLTLLGSNLYCDSESFERLSKQQKVTVQRYMSIFGCALGRPWHMAPEDYVALCPNLASAK